MRTSACKCRKTWDVGTWAGLLFMAFGGIGCGAPEVGLKPQLQARAAKLNTIDAVQLAEQSKSKPVTIEQATEEAAKQAGEPNQAQPTVKLTLEEVRAAALANNLDLKVALIDPAIAQQNIDVERARFESAFFGSADYFRSTAADGNGVGIIRSYEAGIVTPLQTGGSITARLPVADVDGVSEAAASVAFTQSLLRGAGTRINTDPIRIAVYGKGLVDAGTKQAAIDILTNADIVYWGLYAARKALDVNREQYKLAENQLDFARRKVEAGSAAKIEIVRAEAGLASRLDAVISSETDVRDLERVLRRIMNRKDMPMNSNVGILTATEPEPRGLDLDREALVTAAMENRAELLGSDLNLAIDDIQIDQARNNLLPAATFNYTYTAAGVSRTTGRALGDIFDRPSEDHAVGLSVDIPLGNLAAEARLRQARLARIQDQLSREQLAQGIRREVYDAVDALEQNWRRILAAEQGVARAYRQYNVEQSQFQLGQRTSKDVLLAAEDLAGAQSRRISAFADYEIAQVNLARATGTLLGHSGVQLEPVAVGGK